MASKHAHHFRWILLALALAASAAAAQEAYPAKTIRFIAPFPPGGTTDVLCRLLAQKLTDGLGRQVVANPPGTHVDSPGPRSTMG